MGTTDRRAFELIMNQTLKIKKDEKRKKISKSR